MILSNSRTLLEDIKVARKDGFTEDFIYRDKKIFGRHNNQFYAEKDCTLIESCVHSGMSDPSDQSILFLISCTDGTKGCLSSSYGVYADAELIEFCLSLKKLKVD